MHVLSIRSMTKQIDHEIITEARLPVKICLSSVAALESMEYHFTVFLAQIFDVLFISIFIHSINLLISTKKQYTIDFYPAC